MNMEIEDAFYASTGFFVASTFYGLMQIFLNECCRGGSNLRNYKKMCQRVGYEIDYEFYDNYKKVCQLIPSESFNSSSREYLTYGD